MKQKKSETLLMEYLVFILLIVIFAVGVSAAVIRVGGHTGLHEQILAKQLALVINKAESGMKVEIDLTHYYNILQKNKFSDTMIMIDNDNKVITARLIDGKGFSYNYFNEVTISWNIDKEKRILIMEFN